MVPALAFSWLLAGQSAPPEQAFSWWYLIATGGIVIVLFLMLNYSGSKVRSTVAEPWRNLSDLMNTDLNLGFFLQTPVLQGKYRGVGVKAWSSGNLLVKTFRTHLEVTMTQEVPYQIYLYGQFVNDHLGTIYQLEDLSKEIPDFHGQLLYKGVSNGAATSLASPQVMQVLQSHPHGALKISSDAIEFETSTILADPNGMLEIYRWLIEMGKYVTQLR